MHVFLYASMTVDLPPETLKALGDSTHRASPPRTMGTTMRRIDTALGGNRIITRTCASFLREWRRRTPTFADGCRPPPEIRRPLPRASGREARVHDVLRSV